MAAPLSRPARFRIGRSVAGLGMFALAPIKKGQFIARYSGRKIDTETADELNNKYLFEINTRWTIDGATRRNVARYINHSCRPNAEAYFVGHVIKIRAIKNIKLEEEITYNYGRDYFDCFIKAVGCKCIACAKKKAKLRAEKRKSAARRKKRAEAAARKRAAARMEPIGRVRPSSRAMA
jgi:SET domain-containing protein